MGQCYGQRAHVRGLYRDNENAKMGGRSERPGGEHGYDSRYEEAVEIDYWLLLTIMIQSITVRAR